MPVYFNEYVMCEIQANPVINQVFRRKTQVIKIMNVGGCGGGGGWRLGGKPGGRQHFVSGA